MRRNESDEAAGAAFELSRLGEFGVIARLTSGLRTRSDVIRGVGDDAALLDTGGANLLVATCDAQVEGVHFLPGLASYEEIGHKALAVNLSDIAAMGAEPRWALVSLIIPHELAIASLDQLYAGMRALADRYSVAIVGGNVSQSPGPLCIDVTMLGAVERAAVLLRSGAHVGDRILITGTLGAAAAGTVWLVSLPDPLRVAKISLPARERSRQAMVAPLPQVALGRAIAATGKASAMIDVSDGVALDLWHVCQASHVGAVVEADRLPIDPATYEVAGVYQLASQRLALHGGEDYILLLTADEKSVPALQAAISQSGGESYVIGRITDQSEGIQLLGHDGALTPLPHEGFDHFAGPASW